MVCFCLGFFFLLDMADVLIAKALLVNCLTIMEPFLSPDGMLHFHLHVPHLFFPPACLHVVPRAHQEYSHACSQNDFTLPQSSLIFYA